MSVRAEPRPGVVSALRRALRRVAPAGAFALVYLGVLAYPVLRISGLSLPGWQPGTLLLLAILAGPALARLACEELPPLPGRILAALVMTWLGACFIAFCLVLPWELANVVLPLSPQSSGVALAGATGILTVLGFGLFHHRQSRALRGLRRHLRAP